MRTSTLWIVSAAAGLIVGSASPRADAGERTIVVGIELDRDAARLVSYTLKERPFLFAPASAPVVGALDSDLIQLEVGLLDGAGGRFVRRVVFGPICLAHGPEEPPHFEGDTYRNHRDTFLVELPERPGFDRLEITIAGAGDESSRRELGSDTLDVGRFEPAAGPFTYRDLAFADPEAPVMERRTPSLVHWPDEYGDPDVYRVYGDESEAGERVSIVLVPDGYLYSQKATMEAHADAMVAHFRTKTPFAEHDAFINYTLVYAYSTESGTDQCDCGIIRDTPFSTRFPDTGAACGNTANRCLSVGSGCDPTSPSSNILDAEMRAPAHDRTVVLVNTTRYGGCGGSRATYSAGNGAGVELAVHELGHAFAGLADEYGGNNSCGSGSGANVSTNAVDGSWPEWIADIGAPRQGGRYYDQCVYRPLADCEMRNLDQAFCPVCNQRWALRFFANVRVAPTAPITSQSPPSSTTAVTGVLTAFAVVTRLASGPQVTDEITWRLQGPGFPTPTIVATGADSLDYAFALPGSYILTCEVIADTNFIKPSRNGANVDVATWSVDVCDATPPPPLGNAVAAIRSGGDVQLTWTDAPGATEYEVERSAQRDFTPPRVALGSVPSGVAGILDSGALTLPGLHTYRVAESRCGVVGSW